MSDTTPNSDTQPSTPAWDESDDYDYDNGDWVECETCGGEGQFHDCGEDCCPCWDAEGPPYTDCDICDGHGGWLVVPE